MVVKKGTQFYQGKDEPGMKDGLVSCMIVLNTERPELSKCEEMKTKNGHKKLSLLFATAFFVLHTI